MSEELKMKNEEWQKIELSNILEISKNKFNPKSSNENKKCIELEHISQGTGKLLGCINSNEQQSIKNVFKKNQVLFGKLRPYLKKYWKAEFDGVCSTEIWVLDSKSITNDFLFQFIQTEKFNQIANVSSGSKMPRADWKYMAEIPFNIPPLKEQQKIAQILSTWDDAISKQEELIVAKERLKKGLMQRWIISDQWEMIKLDEILYEHKNKSNGKEEVYSVSVHKGLVNQIKHLGRSYSAKDTSNYNLVSPHDIVYTKSPTGDFPYGIIKENKTNKEVIVSPLYGVFSPKNKYVACILDAYFISYIRTNNYLRPLIQKGAKNTMSISNSTFLSRSIKFPKTEQEQQKIAQILTTADKEIELLKNELTALKEQKRGLMQRLLSGVVRVKV
ncbi:MAG: restriction endonuclease subunit S [Sulfurovum sp.]|nr:restriction endonuclease subunit S [Sulfurovum sp.]